MGDTLSKVAKGQGIVPLTQAASAFSSACMLTAAGAAEAMRHLTASQFTPRGGSIHARRTDDVHGLAARMHAGQGELARELAEEEFIDEPLAEEFIEELSAEFDEVPSGGGIPALRYSALIDDHIATCDDVACVLCASVAETDDLDVAETDDLAVAETTDLPAAETDSLSAFTCMLRSGEP
jgi:hypothetical protein